MCTHTTTGWEKASTVANYIQLIVVGLSLWFIGSQLQQQKLQLTQQLKLSRAANTQALVNLVTPLNLRVTDRAITELWVKGDDGINKLADDQQKKVETEQYEILLASYMTFYENVYSQHQEGLLDDDIYNGWDGDLAGFIEERKMATRWNKWRDLYRKDFSEHVDQIIASQKSTPSR